MIDKNFIIKHLDYVLEGTNFPELGEKKVGFGAGKYNGFGGKVKKGEAIEVAATREIREEFLTDVVGWYLRTL